MDGEGDPGFPKPLGGGVNDGPGNGSVLCTAVATAGTAGGSG